MRNSSGHPSSHSIRTNEGTRLTYKNTVRQSGKVKSHRFQSEDGTVTAYVRPIESTPSPTPPRGLHARLFRSFREIFV